MGRDVFLLKLVVVVAVVVLAVIILIPDQLGESNPPEIFLKYADLSVEYINVAIIDIN